MLWSRFTIRSPRRAYEFGISAVHRPNVLFHRRDDRQIVDHDDISALDGDP
jgi:hypothetical protein